MWSILDIPPHLPRAGSSRPLRARLQEEVEDDFEEGGRSPVSAASRPERHSSRVKLFFIHPVLFPSIHHPRPYFTRLYHLILNEVHIYSRSNAIHRNTLNKELSILPVSGLLRSWVETWHLTPKCKTTIINNAQDVNETVKTQNQLIGKGFVGWIPKSMVPSLSDKHGEVRLFIFCRI